MEDWHGGLRLWSIYLQVQLVKDLICVAKLTEVYIMGGGGIGVLAWWPDGLSWNLTG